MKWKFFPPFCLSLSINGTLLPGSTDGINSDFYSTSYTNESFVLGQKISLVVSGNVAFYESAELVRKLGI